ncbi:hypothetical protein [Cytobacillus praedii]|uniref:Uncharacterized protein n=1 Tax=Cytobacillus praedii TaxID=1742358 RepID=A0A4R1ARQ9_9BACI|nr:hypothetical protein [Cytobacillus praedii]TCJ00500.1 hypothetical protein E0Y62_26620 [Cytobacillus praedii]
MALKLMGGDKKGKVWLSGKDNNFKPISLEIFNNRFSIEGEGYSRMNMTIDNLIDYCKSQPQLAHIERLCGDDIVHFYHREDLNSSLKETLTEIENTKEQLKLLEEKLQELENVKQIEAVDTFADNLLKLSDIEGEFTKENIVNLLNEFKKVIK